MEEGMQQPATLKELEEPFNRKITAMDEKMMDMFATMKQLLEDRGREGKNPFNVHNCDNSNCSNFGGSYLCATRLLKIDFLKLWDENVKEWIYNVINFCILTPTREGSNQL
ncbi:hypothetical protein E2542_SST18746 [Spatholobus suberectus]|nr:hypothetical protein E2542_SST18746 [Spatholobus suberectus]